MDLHRIFGKLPGGERLARVKASPQYKTGRFINQSITPDLSEDATMWKLLRAYRRKPKTIKPPGPVPVVHPDFSAAADADPSLIWFGHSSYYLELEGLKMLVDPVFGNRASPVPGMITAFEGTDIVKPGDLPVLDYVLITHDHYDHLDYKTIVQLKSKALHWLCPLGVGAHLEHWGVASNKITELDWWEGVALTHECHLTATPARHFSGRGLKRAQSLWSSFVLKTPRHKIYIGGDSGWDNHFEEIGKRFGPFDLAILECGQYHPYWKHIHMMPEEVALAVEKLGAGALLPVHWGRFALALHPWDEPITRLLEAASGKPFRVLTPMIGQRTRPLSGESYDESWWEI